jgi:thiamine kinase-like enzyme
MKEEEEARAALASIPELGCFTGPIERLGGLTNRVYRAGDICLRIPGKGTEEYIDRANEAVAARQAADAGVSPEVLHFDGQGVMATRYVHDAVTMTPELFASRGGAAARAGEAFARLHRSGATFPFRFELFAMIDDYLGILSGKDVALPDGYHDVVAEAQGTVRAALDAHQIELAPCHCDPLCENFLDTGSRMWIVDWEYSGMNDPMWDLGDLAVEGRFAPALEEEMIVAYFGSEPRPAERGRIVVYKAMCDLQPRRRFPRLCRRPLRALPRTDGHDGVRAARRGSRARVMRPR